MLDHSLESLENVIQEQLPFLEEWSWNMSKKRFEDNQVDFDVIGGKWSVHPGGIDEDHYRKNHELCASVIIGR